MEPLAPPAIHDELNWRTQWRRMLSLRRSDITGLLKTTLNNWYEHNVPRLGASVTFYTLLSLTPLLVIVVAVASAAFGRAAAEGQLVWQIRGAIGPEAAETVQALLRGAQGLKTRAVASVLGALTFIFGATTMVSELRDALNTILCVPKRQEAGLRGLVTIALDRTLALAAVVGLGFLLLVSLAAEAAITALGSRYELELPVPEFVLYILDAALSFGAIAALFALIYRLLPDITLEWRDVIPGALVTSLLFSVGKVAIALYLGKAGVGSTYGAAGSLVILLLWVYYSAQIFFLGAEFTAAYAQAFGSRQRGDTGKQAEIVQSPPMTDRAKDVTTAPASPSIESVASGKHVRDP